MRLNNKKLTGINLGALAVLAPTMIELSQHVPAKYAWLGLLLVQGANWLVQHKALTSPNPNGSSRKKLVLAMKIARERNVDVDVLAESRFGISLDQCSNAQLDSLINEMKKKPGRAVPVK